MQPPSRPPEVQFLRQRHYATQLGKLNIIYAHIIYTHIVLIFAKTAAIYQRISVLLYHKRNNRVLVLDGGNIVEQTKRTLQAEYDAIIVGGSFAGLSAAMQLARARRKILVVDSGRPRNRFAPASHGFMGQDGRSPQEIMETGRQQLLAYPTVHFHGAEVTDATQEDDIFVVKLQDGITVDGWRTRAKRLVLATGMADHLPDVPGMQELWGVGVNQCPYCHGYEVAERKFAVFGVGTMSVHQAALVRDWSDDVTLLTNGGDWLTPESRAMLTARGVQVDDAPLLRLVPRGRELEAVEFRDGRVVPYGVMFTGTRWSFASPLAERLGCAVEASTFGPTIKTDMMKETTVPGVFAAGDITNPMPNATLASAAGALAGGGAHQSLLGLKPPMNVESRAAQSPDK